MATGPRSGNVESIRLPIRCDRRIALYRLLGWAFVVVPLSLFLFSVREDLSRGALTYVLVLLAPIGLVGFFVGWLIARTVELSAEGIRSSPEDAIPWADVTEVRARPFLGVIQVSDHQGRSITFINHGRGVGPWAVLPFVRRMSARG